MYTIIYEAWGAGVDVLTSNPIVHFFSFNPIFKFWFNLYKKITVPTRPSNGTKNYRSDAPIKRFSIWEPCTSNAETDAYVRRS